MKHESQKTMTICKLIGIVFMLVIISVKAQTDETLSDDDIKQRPTIILGIIENATATELTNFQVKHRPKGSVVGFSPILPGSRAELGIPPQKLLSETAIVSWTQLGVQYEVTLDLPTEVTDGHADEKILLYTVHSPGGVTVELKAK